MEIKQNMAYVADGEVSYLCIGFTESKEKAILAPYWSDDEDCQPIIQKDDYLIVQNPFDGGWLSEIQLVTGVLEII
jgi:hypothetical protein